MKTKFVFIFITGLAITVGLNARTYAKAAPKHTAKAPAAKPMKPAATETAAEEKAEAATALAMKKAAAAQQRRCVINPTTGERVCSGDTAAAASK